MVSFRSAGRERIADRPRKPLRALAELVGRVHTEPQPQAAIVTRDRARGSVEERDAVHLAGGGEIAGDEVIRCLSSR